MNNISNSLGSGIVYFWLEFTKNAVNTVVKQNFNSVMFQTRGMTLTVNMMCNNSCNFKITVICSDLSIIQVYPVTELQLQCIRLA